MPLVSTPPGDVSSCTGEVTYTGHGLDKPEGNHDKGTLTPTDACETMELSNVPTFLTVRDHLPSLALRWSYRNTILALDSPSFSGLCKILFKVLMNRGSLGATKKTRGAIKIDASRTSRLS